MSNLVSREKETDLKLAVNKVTDSMIGELANVSNSIGVELTDTGKLCGQNVLIKLTSEYGIDFVSRMDKAQLFQILQYVALFELDINSNQVFLDVRKDKAGNIVSIKATPQGSAYENIVRKYGVNIKKLHNPWIIHEGDEFLMPQFSGLQVTPAVFKPTLKGLSGKAIAVCYPLETDDGNVEYLIADREGVKANLVAQILQNALRTKDVNAPSREKIMELTENMTFDEILACKQFDSLINPTYKSPASREAMIVQKMKNNACRHYTKDLGNRNLANKFSEIVDKAEEGSVVSEQTDYVEEKVEDFEVVETAPSKEEVADSQADSAKEETKDEAKEDMADANGEVPSLEGFEDLL